ncbi:AEC family transporter [Natroniella acetigena]|uniref:AEC family transporter n=1 Tax=Natroniella acetigena TaxID=52004 RepID=UPI002009F7E9|nr:AEC family transporter [Natroniella acetigena]
MFNQILILFLVLALGFAIRKFNLVNENLNENLSNIVLYISLPALILISMNYEFSIERLIQIRNVFLIGLGIFVTLILISYLMVNFMDSKQDKKSIYQFMVVFGNTAFIGFPIIEVIFGTEGIFLAAIYNLVVNIFIWTFGIIIMNQEERGFSFRNLLNPGILAVILGFLIFLFSVEIPASINNVLEMLGATTTPLALIVVGSTLSQIELSGVFSNFKLWLITLLKQLIIPVVVFFVLNILAVNPLIISVSVILTGMPVAALTAIFAEKFTDNSALASEGVFLSTLLSLLTIPLLVYIIQGS